MEGLFYANIAAFAAVLLVLLLRRIFRNKLSSAVFVLLWLTVIARLLIPFELSSGLSVYRAEEEPSYLPGEPTAYFLEEAFEAPDYFYESEKQNPVSVNTPGNKNVKISSKDMFFAIWLFGAVLCGGFFAAKHSYNVKKIMQSSIPFDDLPEGFEKGKIRFYKNKYIQSPLSFGLLRPAIIIPEEILPEQLPFALLHEQTHIKNRDAALKAAALAALSLNWFNPMVWIMVKFFARDVERLCDERVLSIIGNEKAPLYANTILDFAEKESLSFSFFSAAPLRERVIAIMKNKSKKKCLPAAICIFILLVLVITACGTTPREPQKEPIKAGNLSETIQNAAENPSELLEIESGEISSAEEELLSEQIQMQEENYEYTVPGDFGGYRIDFTWPCGGTTVTVPLWGYKGHTGIDIEGSPKDEIYAAAKGTVAKVERSSAGYGYYMVIDHGNEVSTLYARCSDMYVHEGQKVEKGELIGLTGSTGNSAGNHLHFELRYGELWLNPLKHIPSPEQEKLFSSQFEQAENVLDFVMPCSGRITHAFGVRNHEGIDFSDKIGSEIYAAADGEVFFTETDSSANGNAIGIDHGESITTFYAHCDEIFVEKGQKVKAGELIATMGATGNSTGPNLHFEIRKGKTLLDPAEYLPLSSQSNDSSTDSGSCEQVFLTLKIPCEGEVFAIFEPSQNHLGVDFMHKAGSDIFAAAEGTVVKAKSDDPDYGNCIIIDHGNGYQTLYAHCDEIFAELGSAVKAGEVIASMGSTGKADGPKLHFELRINGKYANPSLYFE